MAPPRKRARTAAASQTPTQSTPPASSPPTTSRSVAADTPSQSQFGLPPESWTPSQTTSLFKSIIRTKPTGIHKHMHMLSILQTMHNDHASAYHTSGGTLPKHLKRDGVWARLETLYDLAALDEREDAYRRSGPRFKRGRDGVAREVVGESDDDDEEYGDEFEERPFSLLGHEPGDGDEDGLHSLELGAEEADLARMMWVRRLKKPSDKASETDGDVEIDDQDTAEDGQGAEDGSDEKKVRPRAGRRASTRHAAVSPTPAASTSGAEGEDGNEESDEPDASKQDSATSSPPTSKPTRSSTRTRASGRVIRRK